MTGDARVLVLSRSSTFRERAVDVVVERSGAPTVVAETVDRAADVLGGDGAPVAIVVADLSGYGPGTLRRLWELDSELIIVACVPGDHVSAGDLEQQAQLMVLRLPLDALCLAHAVSASYRFWRLIEDMRARLHVLDTLMVRHTAELERARERIERGTADRQHAEGDSPTGR